MSVKEIVDNLYAHLPLKSENDKGEHLNFYYFMTEVYEQFIGFIKENATKDELESILIPESQSEHFRKPYTKERFINCLKKICKQNLDILALCYKGNLLEANKALEKELFTAQFGRYLVEHYVTNLQFKIETRHEYYRMRDEKAIDDKGCEIKVDNCWHVPFDIRHFSYTGRYNLPGYPCLYLGDSMETSDSEIGKLKNGEKRWVATFRFKKAVSLYDLRIPSKEDIGNKTKYELFQLLLSYPLVAICTAKSYIKGFNEEYFFPQLLFHYILNSGDKALSYKGIIYSSTKNPGGYNIVLPALYKAKVPPQKGYSLILKDMLEMDTPLIYK